MQMGDIERLVRQFRRVFPEAGPPQVCRAPGRVNLLGEHLDYNGLPVLPVTLNRHVAIAFAPELHSVMKVCHVQDAFDDGAFINTDERDPDLQPRWLQYGQAVVHVLNRHFGVDHYPGMAAVVDGDLPIAAGLSSSAALTIAFALAYLRILDKELNEDISRAELAAVCMEAERLTGVPCGGMDQAIGLLGKEKHACKIDFDPLRTEYLPLFRDAEFVVCNSLVAAEKAAGAQRDYAGGPALCAVIRELIERQLREEIDPEFNVRSLADLWYGDLCLTHNEAEELFDRVFVGDATPIQEVAKRLNITPERVLGRVMNGAPDCAELPLRRRARHQRTEFWRVEEGRDTLLAGDAEYFGELMTQSHASCANDYEVSCRELDALVDIALDAGALGARMTGAGFGGCVVSLVRRDDVKRFTETIKANFYRGFCETKPPKDAILHATTSTAAGYVIENAALARR